MTSADDDTILAGVKRSIDASNRRRVQTVDRLSVLALKVYHIEQALTDLADAQIDDQQSMRQRLAGLQEQRIDLGNCLDGLLADIRAGRIGLKLYRQVKVYREVATGRLKADLV